MGYNASHICNFPEDWVTPGGMPSDNYRQTSPNMQTSAGVISNKELKHSKFMRENNLLSQSLGIKKHARTH